MSAVRESGDSIATPEQRYDLEQASRWAFLYTATEKGNASGIHFAATVDDAMKWCESDVSRGVTHGTQWAYFWTSAATFIQHKAEYIGYRPRIVISKLRDNGRWDERIAAAGIQKVSLSEFKALFSPMGIEVVE